MRVLLYKTIAYLSIATLFAPIHLNAKGEESMAHAPERSFGKGPYKRLILRAVTLIDGTGAPPSGPLDIVIEGNRITRISLAGFPKLPLGTKIGGNTIQRPKAMPGDKEMDLEGMYVLPGFINAHAHIGPIRATGADYIYKLWLAHGITTIREVLGGNGFEWIRKEKRRSQKNDIAAPRIIANFRFGMSLDTNKKHHSHPSTAKLARKWVRDLAKKGGDGIKFFGAPPKVFQAAIDEAKKRGLKTTAHHSQTFVARADVLETARWGLDSMEHWYGLPEALFEDRTVQNFPAKYNYLNEQDRFLYAGELWNQAAKPGSKHWKFVRDELIKLNFTINPTFTIYEATRDLMRARRAEHHDAYTLPALWEHFSPNRAAHGSFWFYWTTENEVTWKRNFKLWMQFINDYKNHGGRVTVGEDAGFLYSLYGFGYIRELELLREAGFHPLEVIRAATLYGAESIGKDEELGSVEVGKLADLIVMSENPLEHLGSLYGTGTIKLNDKNEVTRVGGVSYTIKDGIVYDAKKLLADVRATVRKAKEKEKDKGSR